MVTVLTVSCLGSSATPIPVPPPPAELTTLPLSARLRCPEDPNLRGNEVLWELPGLPPTDPDSAYMGRRGRDLGRLADCTSVYACAYAWSEADKTFWVLVTTCEVAGWVQLDRLDLGHE